MRTISCSSITLTGTFYCATSTGGGDFDLPSNIFLRCFYGVLCDPKIDGRLMRESSMNPLTDRIEDISLF